MNDWERLHRQAERYKQSYPPGTRVMLLNMNDPYSPVESGMRGTVQSVDDNYDLKKQAEENNHCIMKEAQQLSLFDYQYDY